MDTQGIEQMLNVLGSTAAQASGKPAESAASGAAGGVDFASGVGEPPLAGRDR